MEDPKKLATNRQVPTKVAHAVVYWFLDKNKQRQPSIVHRMKLTQPTSSKQFAQIADLILDYFRKVTHHTSEQTPDLSTAVA